MRAKRSRDNSLGGWSGRLLIRSPPAPGQQLMQSRLPDGGDACDDVGPPGLRINVVELCSGAERTNGGPPCAATVGAYEQMVVCTENLILVDYVTESPNVNGDDRALLPLPDPVRLPVQVEEPT